MKAVLFATILEAEPFLHEMARHLSQAPLEQNVHRFQCGRPTSDIIVAVVGMGKPAAREGTERVVATYAPTSMLNIGIAGALTETVSVGGIYRAAAAVDWTETARMTYPLDIQDFTDLPQTTLVTSNEPVFDDALRTRLSEYGDIVDMEGAAIAQVGVAHGVSTASLKGISDTAGEGDRKMLQENLVRISTLLAAAVVPRFIF